MADIITENSTLPGMSGFVGYNYRDFCLRNIRICRAYLIGAVCQLGAYEKGATVAGAPKLGLYVKISVNIFRPIHMNIYDFSTVDSLVECYADAPPDKRNVRPCGLFIEGEIRPDI